MALALLFAVIILSVTIGPFLWDLWYHSPVRRVKGLAEILFECTLPQDHPELTYLFLRLFDHAKATPGAAEEYLLDAVPSAKIYLENQDEYRKKKLLIDLSRELFTFLPRSALPSYNETGEILSTDPFYQKIVEMIKQLGVCLGVQKRVTKDIISSSVASRIHR